MTVKTFLPHPVHVFTFSGIDVCYFKCFVELFLFQFLALSPTHDVLFRYIGNHKGRAEVQFACCSETHTSMTVQLRLQRRAFSYVFSHYLPLLWMLALASSTLLIPNDRTDLRLIAGRTKKARLCQGQVPFFI